MRNFLICYKHPYMFLISLKTHFQLYYLWTCSGCLFSWILHCFWLILTTTASFLNIWCPSLVILSPFQIIWYRPYIRGVKLPKIINMVQPLPRNGKCRRSHKYICIVFGYNISTEYFSFWCPRIIYLLSEFISTSINMYDFLWINYVSYINFGVFYFNFHF